MRKSNYLLLSAMVFTGLAATSCALDDSPPGSADADDSSQPSPGITQSASQQPYCVVEAVDVQAGTAAAASNNTPPAMRCFQSFAGAISAATRGRVLLPATATADTVDDETLNGTAAAANTPFVVGIEFQNAGFVAPTLIVTAPKGCSKNVPAELRNMPAGWNDNISSAQAFSHCNHSYHYQNSGRRGKRHDCGTECRFIGNELNDATSSIFWTHDPL
jgi:hypothetical protein